ncbi:MAG: NFACT RNA binding domain-containing protein [Candidatus Marsarchaeota archaeon]|nr:NFACT RNA binding domain-containing protein [Candidatus Marsarchaeota archaeon]
MELTLDLRKTVRQSLQERYAALRKLKDKKAGLLTATEETKKEMEELEREKNEKEMKKKEMKTGALSPASAKKTKSGKAKTYWYDEYHAFVSSSGRRVVAGKDAKQNDELYAKHLMVGDLFFHADIQGAPTTILKDGQKAGEEEKKEAAQWAASYSSAWKTGAAAVDVYAVTPQQVGKNAVGGYVGRGAFVIEGEREWFRETKLELRIGWMEEKLSILPAAHPQPLRNSIILTPGPMPKEEAAKLLAGKLGAKMEEVSRLLPSGKFSLRG